MTPDELVAANAGDMFFFVPSNVAAGESTTMYFNRAASPALASRPTIILQYGFNDWQWENSTSTLMPTNTHKDGGNDWWSTSFDVPKEAYEMNFVLHDSDGLYENNGMANFWAAVNGGTYTYEAFAAFIKAEKERAEQERAASEAREKAAKSAAEAEETRAREEKEEKRRLAEALAGDRRVAEEAINSARMQAEQSSRELPTSVKGRFYAEPSSPAAGKSAKLFYNAKGTPLEGSEEVYVVVGSNSWQGEPSQTLHMQRVSQVAEPSASEVADASASEAEDASASEAEDAPASEDEDASASEDEDASASEEEDGKWFMAEISVPTSAWQLDFVTTTEEADGCGAYDNNGMQDYHLRVEHGMDEAYWEALIQEKTAEATAAREVREAEEAAKQRARAVKRAAQREAAMEAVRFSQSHVWYSEPAVPSAGNAVKIFYNPRNTCLNGNDAVYVRGGWNRWTHGASWGPVKMERVTTEDDDSHYLVAEITAPPEAWCADFVFSDGPEEHASYDNNGGLDFHLPLQGASATQPPMHIMHVAVEMAPIAKVGGLGDVVTSISRAIIDAGHQVEVVLPKYDCINYDAVRDLREEGGFQFGGTYVRIFRGEVVGVPTYFLAPDSGIFNVGCVYGRNDDAGRFGFFCNAALDFMLATGRHPDIVHCHDWSSAPVASMLNNYHETYLGKTRAVFTIHNLNYGADLIGQAMAACSMATTVSPTYANEISGHPAIAPNHGKFHGIRNGIDPDIWSPEDDMWLPVHYDETNIVEGKAANKLALQQRLNMAQDPDRPLVGIVTRLTHQKGIHLIEHAIHKVLERGGQVVLLGSAPDPRVQGGFEAMRHGVEQTPHGRMVLTYDEPLSHLIYAGADFICVPSMFEPCGLTQMIAMRFGSVPIVRKTGGLNDTVFDVTHDEERCTWYGYETNGFSFDGTDNEALDYALNRALDAYYDGREWLQDLQRRCLMQDFTWNRPAVEYLELYYQASKQ